MTGPALCALAILTAFRMPRAETIDRRTGSGLDSVLGHASFRTDATPGRSGHKIQEGNLDGSDCKDDIISHPEYKKKLTQATEKRHMLPVKSGLNVTVELQVQTISTLSETQAEFEIDILYSQIWKDPKLAFEGLNSCKTNITLNPDFLGKVWSPNICLVNTKNAKVHESPTDNIFVILYDDGKVWVNYRLKATGPCDLDLRLFPFDHQSCNLAFESYSYNAAEVGLVWLNENPVGFLPNAIQLPDFDLVRNVTEKYELSYPNGNWDRLTVRFTFQRRFGFYIFQAYVPTFIIIASSWIGFCMDAKALPARTTVGVSSLLALTFQFGNIIKNLPKVSYVKAMDIWMLVSVSFVFGTLMELAIICWLTKTRTNTIRRKSTMVPRTPVVENFNHNSQVLPYVTNTPDMDRTVMDTVSYQDSPILTPKNRFRLQRLFSGASKSETSLATTTCYCEMEEGRVTTTVDRETGYYRPSPIVQNRNGGVPSVPYIAGLAPTTVTNTVTGRHPARLSRRLSVTRSRSRSRGRRSRSKSKSRRFFGRKWKPACTPEFIDHFSTIFFPLAFVLFNSMYWGYYIQKIITE